MFLLLIVIDPITNVLTDYNKKNYDYNMGLFDSYAVVYVEYKDVEDTFEYELICDAFSSEEEKTAMRDEINNGTGENRYLLSIVTSKLNIDIDKYMNEFYVCLGDEETYVTKKVESELFDEFGKVKEDAKAADLSEFYTFMYSNALRGEKFKTYQDGKLYNLGITLNKIDTIKAYGAYLLALCGLYLIVPIVFKRRQTLGKMVMKLQVVNMKTNEIASRPQMIVRFIALAIIEFLLAMLLSSLLYLPLLVSIILMVVTLNQSAIHDFIAKTKVVEVPYVNPYTTKPVEENEPIDVKVESVNE